MDRNFGFAELALTLLLQLEHAAFNADLWLFNESNLMTIFLLLRAILGFTFLLLRIHTLFERLLEVLLLKTDLVVGQFGVVYHLGEVEAPLAEHVVAFN